jgi:hypothetical protein
VTDPRVWSWCRIFAVGPPCAAVCGNCKAANADLQSRGMVRGAESQSFTREDCHCTGINPRESLLAQPHQEICPWK